MDLNFSKVLVLSDKEHLMKTNKKRIIFVVCTSAFGSFLLRFLMSALCTDSLSALVVATPLQRDLDDLVPKAHVKLAAAVQDQQAPYRLPLPGREQLDLFQ